MSYISLLEKKVQKNEVSFVVQVYNKTSRPLFTAVDDGQNNGTPLSCYTYQYNILRYIIICACMEKMGTIAGFYTYLSSSEVGGGFPVAF